MSDPVLDRILFDEFPTMPQWDDRPICEQNAASVMGKRGCEDLEYRADYRLQRQAKLWRPPFLTRFSNNPSTPTQVAVWNPKRANLWFNMHMVAGATIARMAVSPVQTLIGGTLPSATLSLEVPANAIGCLVFQLRYQIDGGMTFSEWWCTVQGAPINNWLDVTEQEYWG